jgi:hypothetical protein
MNTRLDRRIGPFVLLFLALVLFAPLLAGCAPAAGPEPAEVVETVEVEVEEPAVEEPAPEEEQPVEGGEPQEPTAPEAPSTPADSVVGEATEKPAELLPSPTPAALPTPLQPLATAPLQPSPTPLAEERLVEIEWPPTMRLGDSDIVRLALIPTQQGYVVQAEYPEHQVITQTVSVERPGGYDLFAVARLDGVGFDIAPGGDQVQYLAPDQAVAWRWSLSPRSSGQQRLLAHLILRWQPTSQSAGALRQVVALSQGLDVHVVSFFGLTQLQALFTGLFGLVLGGGLCLFALIVMRPRQAQRLMQIGAPNPSLAIELPPGLSLAPQERAVLQTLFQRYDRLVIKDEFLSGYSGARTFLALPVRPDGRADAYTIAKLGERASILREYQNYETYVKDTLPPITARIQRPPVTVGGGLPTQTAQLAALQYTFIGEPGSSPSSLRQTLLDKPDPALLYKLFDTFGPNWWMQRRPYTFRLGQEYDRMLPTHLVIEPAEGSGQALRGDTPPGSLDLGVGDLVTLRDFPSCELRSDGRSLSLHGHKTPGHPPLRVRWLSPERSEGLTGRVVATRWELLRKSSAGAELFGLPDPIPRIPEWLTEAITAGQSTIHGDLNPENILVGPGGLVWLIDFAQTRDGHTLYDFAHLEAEIIAHVISRRVHDAHAYRELLDNPARGPYSGLYALRLAVQSIATRCLFNPSQSREYHLALTLACLGALKFANLDDHARHLLYLTAAHQAQNL